MDDHDPPGTTQVSGQRLHLDSQVVQRGYRAHRLIESSAPPSAISYHRPDLQLGQYVLNRGSAFSQTSPRPISDDSPAETSSQRRHTVNSLVPTPSTISRRCCETSGPTVARYTTQSLRLPCQASPTQTTLRLRREHDLHVRRSPVVLAQRGSGVITSWDESDVDDPELTLVR